MESTETNTTDPISTSAQAPETSAAPEKKYHWGPLGKIIGWEVKSPQDETPVATTPTPTEVPASTAAEVGPTLPIDVSSPTSETSTPTPVIPAVETSSSAGSVSNPVEKSAA